MSTNLPGQFGHVDLDDLDFGADDDELAAFDGALAELPRSEPPRSSPPEE